MEKPPRSKGSNIFKYLPKSTSFVVPKDRPAKAKAWQNKAFSGPIVSIIPKEARRKKESEAFDAQEPTSPKISCIGQIKHRKIKAERCKGGRCKWQPAARQERRPPPSSSGIRRLFRRKVTPGQGPDKVEGAAEGVASAAAPARAPALSQMRRFASGREGLSGFDWRDVGVKGYADEDDDDEEEVIVPHSAPLMMGGGVAVQPKKEVNIWRRRTMSPPLPLELNSSR